MVEGLKLIFLQSQSGFPEKSFVALDSLQDATWVAVRKILVELYSASGAGTAGKVFEESKDTILEVLITNVTALSRFYDFLLRLPLSSIESLMGSDVLRPLIHRLRLLTEGKGREDVLESMVVLDTVLSLFTGDASMTSLFSCYEEGIIIHMLTEAFLSKGAEAGFDDMVDAHGLKTLASVLTLADKASGSFTLPHDRIESLVREPLRQLVNYVEANKNRADYSRVELFIIFASSLEGACTLLDKGVPGKLAQELLREGSPASAVSEGLLFFSKEIASLIEGNMEERAAALLADLPQPLTVVLSKWLQSQHDTVC